MSKCFVDNARRFGSHLQTVKKVSDKECYDKCLENDECKNFDYKKSSKICLLKKNKGKFTRVNGYKTSCSSFKQGSKPTTSTSPKSTTVWKDNWNISRNLWKVMEDSKDSKASMRGTGKLTIKNGIMHMEGDPRYYIKSRINKDENVTMTAYFKLKKWKDNRPYSSSGFTLVTMSTHDNYKNNSCDANSYYMRLWHDGVLGFQQEFKHTKNKQWYGNYIINGKRGVKIFKDGIPKDKWIGLRLKVERIGNTTWLKGYTNIDNSGWKLRLIVNAKDVSGWDPCYHSKPITSGDVSFIRTDNADTVLVKDASIVKTKQSLPLQTVGIESTNYNKIYVIMVIIIIAIMIIYRKQIKRLLNL